MWVAKPFTSGMRLCGDDIFDLVYSVPADRRSGARFKIWTGAELELRFLKDGSGRYLLTDLSSHGRPSTLLGYPIMWDSSSNLLTGKAIQFGTDYEQDFGMSNGSCRYCGTMVYAGNKRCVDGCGAPY